MVTNYVDATKVVGSLSSAVVPAYKVAGTLSNANINGAHITGNILNAFIDVSRVTGSLVIYNADQNVIETLNINGYQIVGELTNANIDASKMILSGALANKLSGPIYGVEVYLESAVCTGKAPDLAIPAIASPYPMDYVFASVLCQKLSYTANLNYISQYNYISFIQPDAVHGNSQCYVKANEHLSSLVELCTYFVFNDIPSV